jgi:DNA-directed RNA polymerase specialized sigma24 family protein
MGRVRDHNTRDVLFPFGAPGGFLTDSDSLTDERLASLYSAVRLLKPVDRSLILMWLDDLSYREMAEVLGLSESNVGVKINADQIGCCQAGG